MTTFIQILRAAALVLSIITRNVTKKHLALTVLHFSEY